jgi:acid phosphatase type 7
VLNGHDHLYARYRPLNPSGKYDPRNGIREFIVGTGGETLDTVVNTGVANTSDPSGNPNFNAQNMEMASGDFWGAMALTLNPNGYTWNFQTALEKPGDGAGPFSDTGFGTCHGGRGDGGWQDGNNQGQNQN